MARKQREILATGGAGLQGIRRARPDRDFHHAVLPSHPAADLRLQHRLASRIPGVTAAQRASHYPEDARQQLQSRARVHRARVRPARRWACGRPKVRCPMKRSRLAAEVGFEWAASDNGVLAQTLHRDAGPEVTYRSYLLAAAEPPASHDFSRSFPERRSRASSIRGWARRKRPRNFWIASATTRVPLAARGADVLVPIILDGENAWEYYYQNGRPFLRELYRRISDSSDLAALTVSEALKADQPRPLDHISPRLLDQRQLRCLDRRAGRQQRLGVPAARAAEIRRSVVRSVRRQPPAGARRTADRRRQRLVLVVWPRASLREPARVRRALPPAPGQRLPRAPAAPSGRIVAPDPDGAGSGFERAARAIPFIQ